MRSLASQAYYYDDATQLLRYILLGITVTKLIKCMIL